MIDNEALKRIHFLFHSCAPLFIALGDEVRQKLILDIADSGEEGINVTNLSAKSNLSRPAISHHLKVLKDCGLIKPVKKGTQIFYELELNQNLNQVRELIDSIQVILGKITKNNNNL